MSKWNAILTATPQMSSSNKDRINHVFPEINHHKPSNFKMPLNILLVDDEKEFVQTLSERLQMRNMESRVAYNGQSALDMIQNDAPEVMIIDLKMPGINGMDVLKEVKQTQPEIEVIVLTGHGSDQDKKKCMEIGAFAYLQKPVDICILTDTLKKAHEETNTKKMRRIVNCENKNH